VVENVHDLINLFLFCFCFVSSAQALIRNAYILQLIEDFLLIFRSIDGLNTESNFMRNKLQ
jgi:hypothetical protein